MASIKKRAGRTMESSLPGQQRARACQALREEGGRATVARRGDGLGRHGQVRRPEGRPDHLPRLRRAVARGAGAPAGQPSARRDDAATSRLPDPGGEAPSLDPAQRDPSLGEAPQHESTDRKALAPSTVSVVHSIVSSVMKAAVRDRRLIANPCDGTRLPKGRGSASCRSDEQVRSSLRSHARGLARARRLRGRVGPTAGRAVRSDVGSGELHAPRACRRPTARDRVEWPPAFAPPKTMASERVVPVSAVVMDALQSI